MDSIVLKRVQRGWVYKVLAWLAGMWGGCYLNHLCHTKGSQKRKASWKVTRPFSGQLLWNTIHPSKIHFQPFPMACSQLTAQRLNCTYYSFWLHNFQNKYVFHKIMYYCHKFTFKKIWFYSLVPWESIQVHQQILSIV